MGNTEECPDCGETFKRLRTHYTYSDCGSDNPSKTLCECRACGEEFEEWTYRVENGRGKFCSSGCKDNHSRNGVTRECANCGEEKYVSPSQMDSMGDYELRNTFCDKGCESEWKRENWVGQDHPSYRGGDELVNTVRTLLGDSPWVRRSEEYREGVEACEKCGAEPNGRGLDTHHIIPVAAGGDNGSWNLMALCIPCHRHMENYIREKTTPYLYELVPDAKEQSAV